MIFVVLVALMFCGVAEASDPYVMPQGTTALSSAALNNDVVVVGTVRDGILVSQDGGASFKTAENIPASLIRPESPATITTVIPVSKTVALAADDFGRVFRSADSGLSWQTSSQGLPVPFDRRTKPVIFATDPARNETVYALLRTPYHSDRIKTYLSRSTDGGQTWVAIKEIPKGEYCDRMDVRHQDHPIVELGNPLGNVVIHDYAPLHMLSRVPHDPFKWSFRRNPSVDPPEPDDLDYDDQNIAILHDDGSFVSVNDLAGRMVRFSPVSGGGYNVTALTAPGITPVGNDLGIQDEDFPRHTETLPFSFDFYGNSHTDIFISDNGNITFGTDDPDFDFEESPQQFEDGPPRIAAMWDDLDPSSGGQILYDANANAVTITWFNVPQFFESDANTIQLTLFPDGTIHIQWDTAMSIQDGLTGIAPGGGTVNWFVDFNLDPPFYTSVVAPDDGLFEFFFLEFWAQRVSQRFFDCHADAYDQLVVFGASDYPYFVAGQNFGYNIGVRNDIDGIGLPTFDVSAAYGSNSVMRSFIGMARLIEFPDNPADDPFSYPPFDSSGLDILGEVTGLTWSAYVHFDDRGNPSDELLGLGLSHWSFYHHTSASIMFGNQWIENGPPNNDFSAVTEARARYSELDLYLMGLIPDTGVTDFWVVTDHSNSGDCVLTPGFCDPTSLPEIGVDATGTRKDVSVNDVIAIEGARSAGGTHTVTEPEHSSAVNT
ncbi:WD40/YVTN/BNR-like repeat-containing protein, partial [Acidobacteriota bacterium]